VNKVEYLIVDIVGRSTRSKRSW